MSDENQGARDPLNTSRETANQSSRRGVVKSLGFGGLALGHISRFPKLWAQPLVFSVLLPAHAQGTIRPPLSSCPVIQGFSRSAGPTKLDTLRTQIIWTAPGSSDLRLTLRDVVLTGSSQFTVETSSARVASTGANVEFVFGVTAVVTAIDTEGCQAGEMRIVTVQPEIEVECLAGSDANAGDYPKTLIADPVTVFWECPVKDEPDLPV